MAEQASPPTDNAEMLKKPEERLIPEVLGKGWEAGLLLRGGGGSRRE